MWPRNIGADSFQVRRDRSPRTMNAPLRVPTSRATELVADLSVVVVGFTEARCLSGIVNLLAAESQCDKWGQRYCRHITQITCQMQVVFATLETCPPSPRQPVGRGVR